MRLIKPTQITGVISTPPIGEIYFLVVFKIGSVGHATIGQGALAKSTLGYQVSTILKRNAKVHAASRKPSER